MLFRELEVNRIAQDGSPLRKLVFIGSRVSVIRSVSEELITIYRDALLGKACADRFSILLDGHTFRPADHLFIGFGEKFEQQALLTIKDYLTGAGLPEKDLESCLLEHGLGGCAEHRCGSLHPPQQKLLRTLAALQQTERIVLLHEPFEDLLPRWREALAHKLIDYSCSKGGMIIVTKLSERPDCWIDSPFIARMQLERPRRLTIGAGTASPPEGVLPTEASPLNASSSIVAHPPAIGAEEVLINSALVPPVAIEPRRRPPVSWIALSIGSATAAAIFLAVIAFPRPENGRPSNYAQSKHSSPNTEPASAMPSNPPPRAKREGLERYPPELRDAILKSFDDLN